MGNSSARLATLPALADVEFNKLKERVEGKARHTALSFCDYAQVR